MWSKIAHVISVIVPQLIKTYLVPFVMGLMGLAGGIWTWIVGFVLSFAWKKAEEEIDSEARLADQTNTDEELNKKYQEDIKNGASETDLIKDETDILNGGRN